MSRPSPEKSNRNRLKRNKERKLQRLLNAVDWDKRKARKAIKQKPRKGEADDKIQHSRSTDRKNVSTRRKNPSSNRQGDKGLKS